MKKLDGRAVTAKLTRADAVDSECTGKSQFKTFRQARYAARRIAAREKEPYAPYRCGMCGSFHVGSSLKPAAKRPRLDPIYDESGLITGEAGELE